MKKRTKVLISTICALVMCFGIVGGVSAANSNGIIKFTGPDGVEGGGDDIIFDASDIKTLEGKVKTINDNITAANDKIVAGKTSLASAINSATASSATNKTTLGTTDANLPAFNDLKNAIANVKAAGNEEGIITGQNNVINNVGGKTSASLGDDGSLTLSYDGTTGTSSVGNPTWAAIENKLSGKTDADGNPIYSGITDLDSLENAITADNDNSARVEGVEIISNQYVSTGYTMSRDYKQLIIQASRSIEAPPSGKSSTNIGCEYKGKVITDDPDFCIQHSNGRFDVRSSAYGLWVISDAKKDDIIKITYSDGGAGVWASGTTVLIIGIY